MSLISTIRSDMIAAMKAKEKLKLSTIRMIISDLKEAEIAKKSDLVDAEIFKRIEKIIKQCHESIIDYNKMDRTNEIEQEQAKITVLESYLPQAPSEDELRKLIDLELKNYPDAKIANLGKIMGSLKLKLPARSNLKFVTEYLKSQLG